MIIHVFIVTVLLLLVWPTSWTPAIGSLFVRVRVCVCPRTFRHFGRRMMSLPSSNLRKALSSQFVMNG